MMQRRCHIGLSVVHPNVYNRQGAEKAFPGNQPSLNGHHNRSPFSVTSEAMREHSCETSFYHISGRANEELKAK